MNKVAILTDSTAYLPLHLKEKYEIKGVPLEVIWGEETFEDGLSISPGEFYTRLKTSKKMPSTSQPSVGKMEAAMKSLLTEGYDILGIFISSKLSGTVQSAMQARTLLPQGSAVEILDSETTTLAMGLHVLAAARAAAEGASLAECREIAELARQKTGVFFMVDTLEFLHRGGRIGGAQRFLGTALNMKPILCMQAGKIESLERVRTKSKAVERLLELVAEKCEGKSPLHLAAVHANAPAEAQALLDRAQARLNPVETILGELSPVVGTHVGPGTLALAYMAGM
jgi:DegV family protein with EDD domain